MYGVIPRHGRESALAIAAPAMPNKNPRINIRGKGAGLCRKKLGIWPGNVNARSTFLARFKNTLPCQSEDRRNFFLGKILAEYQQILIGHFGVNQRREYSIRSQGYNRIPRRPFSWGEGLDEGEQLCPIHWKNFLKNVKYPSRRARKVCWCGRTYQLTNSDTDQLTNHCPLLATDTHAHTSYQQHHPVHRFVKGSNSEI